MELFNNEIKVQQGEEFPIDRLISQSDFEYIPFIVSSERQNPMIAITVASTKFEKNERYVKTWWLDLVQGDGFDQTPLPRFFQTVPQPLFTDSEGNSIDKTENMALTLPIDDEPMECLYYYTKASDSVDPTVGHKPYYYVYFTEDDPNTPRDDYEFRIRMQFRSEDTAEWGSQNYMYQITLVDTIPMANYVQTAYETYPDLDWPEWASRDDPDWDKPVQAPGESTEDYNARVEASWVIFRNNWILANINELFWFIKNRLPKWFQPDIDVDSPAGKIGIPQSIMPPTKVQVDNNLRKLI